MVDPRGMDEFARASFLRRLAAFVIDAVTVLVLAMAFFVVWTVQELGGLPETPAEAAAVLAAGQEMMPRFMVQGWLVYVVASWTPFLGRRTVGMRQLGIQVVRDGRTS